MHWQEVKSLFTVKWVKCGVMTSVKLCKARGRKCVQHVGGPTVTLSKHGSLAQGLFWDPLVAPWPRAGTREDHKST